MARDPNFDWKAVLEGNDPRARRFRSFFRRIPSSPRCKMCAAPFEGPGAPVMRAVGRGRWPKNPNYCGACQGWVRDHPGGAEVELTFLFADVRGSTGLGERLTPTGFSELLSRFYEISARVVVAHDGIVDKFVGDEIVAFFVPPFAGPDHPADGIAAARELVRETGQGSADGPAIAVGAGVHTGVAFVGSVGDGDVTDFTALGDPVNTTARLASAAGAGEVLVTQAAATAASLPTDGLERRRLDLRGRAEPIEVVVLQTSPERSAQA